MQQLSASSSLLSPAPAISLFAVPAKRSVADGDAAAPVGGHGNL